MQFQMWRCPTYGVGNQALPHQRTSIIMHAKKGGKQGKVSSLAGLLAKKKEAEDAKGVASPDQYRDPEVRALLFDICTSYHKHTKQPLIETDLDTLADALFNAPFALLAHNRTKPGVTDAVFTYANRAALKLWEATWDELIGIPSSKSAPPDQDTQQDRTALLDTAANTGFTTGYTGVRVSTKGKKFKILDSTLFNIIDSVGDTIGQAALFSKYEVNGKEEVIEGYEEATAAAVAQSAATGPPSEEELQEARDAVAKWAQYVRNLKEVQGMKNKDPEVADAVANMQAWKTRLADMEKRLQDAIAACRAAFDDEDEEEDEQGPQQ